MLEHTDAQLSMPFFADRCLVVQRHAGQISSDAGLLPIRQLDQRLRYTERLIAGLTDERREPLYTQLEIGTHAVHTFEAGGLPHEVAIWGSPRYDADKVVKDLKKRVPRPFKGGAPIPSRSDPAAP